ncbi:hypothetical protein HDK77DRAFT_282760 [Phyllosticta capitalensis]|uniref:PLD phosphodiesterase domain-containing protein n=1 Tax=Phyllosticta capitalensis TaxID=121624 RepID=A0ABR1YGY9_9PEZI
MTTPGLARLRELCCGTETVSSLLAADSSGSLSPSEASTKLYGGHGLSVHECKPPRERHPASPEDLELALQCANFGPTRPSDLFLNIWHDSLHALDHDSLAGLVSPPLMGSSGVIPLTIIGPLPDICRHMSNLIARAEKEVILATNYWKESSASRLITDSIKELSVRAGRRGQRAVVKIIYDRGSPKQVFNNHLHVAPDAWTAPGIGLPAADEIPNVDMEVVNFHRPVLGTFHAKFMVVDRKFAVVCSNNIQDNDNLEMMTHLEGPIVDSLYDAALLTWHDRLDPPLPLISVGTAQVDLQSTFDQASFRELVPQSGCFSSQAVADFIRDKDIDEQNLPEHNPGDPHYDSDIAGEVIRVQSSLTPKNGHRIMDAVTNHLNASTGQTLRGDAPDCQPVDNFTPYIPHAVHEPFPIALVNRKPWGAINHSCVNSPQNEAWLSAIRNAESNVFIQSPDINAEPLIPELLGAARRGVAVTLYACLGYNDLGELLPYQGGTNEMVAHRMYSELSPEQRKNLHVHWYVGKDQTKPLNNKFKQRSCHIKLMIVDEHVGIQGSGNQDTQSWYHSQEINIMFDSQSTCREWREAIERNQNTRLYGAVSQEDGIWRDGNGHEAEGCMGVNPGHMAWMKGVVGAVNRVRGVGGF